MKKNRNIIRFLIFVLISLVGSFLIFKSAQAGFSGLDLIIGGSSSSDSGFITNDIASEPTVQANNIKFLTPTYTSMTLYWTSGNGSKRVVFVKQANTGIAEPVDDTAYTASTTFGSGTQIGTSGWYCVYNNTSYMVSVSGLVLGTDYIFQVFEYNESGSAKNYLIDTAVDNPKVQATRFLTEPTVQSSNLVFSSVNHMQIKVSWSAGNGDAHAVFVKQANTGIAEPVDNTSYTASTTFGSGTQIGTSGWYCVYYANNYGGAFVTVTGLTVSTEYIFQIFEFNYSGSPRDYLLATATNNPAVQATTAVLEPTVQARNITFSGVGQTSMTLSWTNGNGTRRILFAKQGNTGTAVPVDNTAYTASTFFGTGSQIGTTGWYCIFNGTSWVEGALSLYAGTDYIFQVFEYNQAGETIDYFLDTAANNPKVQATTALAEPTIQAHSITFSSVVSTGMTISWTNGNGAGRVVYMKQTDTGTAEPVDNEVYTANSVFGSGTQIGTSGWYSVYRGTGTSVSVTGLIGNKNYQVQVFEYNTVSTSYNYLLNTGSNNPSNQLTLTGVIGIGSSITSTSEACPINIYWKSTHGQAVYTVAEINAAGIFGPINFTQIGFYINSAPNTAIPNFIIRMKHTADSNVVNWQTANDMVTVYSAASYLPVAGGFESLTLSTPFTWNGTDNIVVDTAFSITSTPSTSGTIRYFDTTNGYRYARSDTIDQTGVFTGGSTSTRKPQLIITSTPIQYTLTYSAGAHGSITGTSPQTVDYGGNGAEVTATPDTGYHFVSWSDDSTDNPRTDTNITGNVIVSATFVINIFTFTYTAGSNGSISGTSPQTIEYGSNGEEVSAVPDLGYHFVAWSDDIEENPRTDLNATENISVSAVFAINNYTLTYLAGDNGSITGTNSQVVEYGGSASAITAVAAAGFHFVDWSDGSTANPRTDANITGNITVTANFAINPIISNEVLDQTNNSESESPQNINQSQTSQRQIISSLPVSDNNQSEIEERDLDSTENVVETEENENPDYFSTEAYEKNGKIYLSKIRIRIIDQNGNTIPDLKVTIYSDPKNGWTDKNGLVTFQDLEIGEHKVVIDYNNREIKKIVTISEPITKNKEVKLEVIEITVRDESNVSRWLCAGAVILILFVLYLIKRNTKRKK